MKLKSFVGLVAIMLFAIGIFVWSGVFNVSASEKHWNITTRLLEIVREQSIHLRSRNLEVPPLDDADMLVRGARNYSAMCSGCHLAPGMKDTELSLGLYPSPPAFYRSEHALHDPGATFWTIKNGLKMTGMPAWGAFHTDQQIWELVAFLSRVRGMSEAEYNSLAGNGEHTHKNAGGSDLREEAHTQ